MQFSSICVDKSVVYVFWPPKIESGVYFYLKKVVFLLLTNYCKIGYNLKALKMNKVNNFQCLENQTCNS